jgi:hypothetical protein
MATKSQPHDSYPICPTCQSDLTEKKELVYFGSESSSPVTNDDVLHRYEEVSRLVKYLGALAQAGTLAVAQEECRDMPWIGDLSSLAEELAGLAGELTGETERQLALLLEAGRIWQRRAEQTTAGKEG